MPYPPPPPGQPMPGMKPPGAMPPGMAGGMPPPGGMPGGPTPAALAAASQQMAYRQATGLPAGLGAGGYGLAEQVATQQAKAQHAAMNTPAMMAARANTPAQLAQANAGAGPNAQGMASAPGTPSAYKGPSRDNAAEAARSAMGMQPGQNRMQAQGGAAVGGGQGAMANRGAAIAQQNAPNMMQPSGDDMSRFQQMLQQRPPQPGLRQAAYQAGLQRR